MRILSLTPNPSGTAPSASISRVGSYEPTDRYQPDSGPPTPPMWREMASLTLQTGVAVGASCALLAQTGEWTAGVVSLGVGVAVLGHGIVRHWARQEKSEPGRLLATATMLGAPGAGLCAALLSQCTQSPQLAIGVAAASLVAHICIRGEPGK